jgi:hypothetical protein
VPKMQSDPTTWAFAIPYGSNLWVPGISSRPSDLGFSRFVAATTKREIWTDSVGKWLQKNGAGDRAEAISHGIRLVSPRTCGRK